LAGRVRSGALDAVLIAGPTASGKSAAAILLAEAVGGIVINADSMQVYRDLRTLSARPTVEEEARVPHRLFGFVPAAREYSVGDYLKDAAAAYQACREAGRLAIVVGGTGLYFRALTEGLVATPDDCARGSGAGCSSWRETGTVSMRRLAQVDPAAAVRLNPADQPRLMRALEVVLATGRSLADWQAAAQGAPLLPPGRMGRACSSTRTGRNWRRGSTARFIEMMAGDALDEVRSLAALGLAANRGVMKAHGVPHLMAHLRGEMTLDAAIALGQGDTRRYAKRQVTWARKFMADWAWFDSGAAAFAALSGGV
jgi:tRNA dimethylallyltransferase